MQASKITTAIPSLRLHLPIPFSIFPSVFDNAMFYYKFVMWGTVPDKIVTDGSYIALASIMADLKTVKAK